MRLNRPEKNGVVSIRRITGLVRKSRT